MFVIAHILFFFISVGNARWRDILSLFLSHIDLHSQLILYFLNLYCYCNYNVLVFPLLSNVSVCFFYHTSQPKETHRIPCAGHQTSGDYADSDNNVVKYEYEQQIFENSPESSE